jgi:plasmid stabilization system protein ParE
MSGFALHPDADADLDEIWEYVAEDDIDAADRLLNEFYEAIGNLVTFPRSGHIRPDLSSRPIRFQLIREYLIAYVPDSEPLTVLAFLHGRRNPRVIAAVLQHRM